MVLCSDILNTVDDIRLHYMVKQQNTLGSLTILSKISTHAVGTNNAFY